jgi:hypothetical protein
MIKNTNFFINQPFLQEFGSVAACINKLPQTIADFKNNIGFFIEALED